jgi:CBS-domain-containing membrane protein
MAGLAAVVGGVMRSPLTGVVFTLELTHAWNDLTPLLVAAGAHEPSGRTVGRLAQPPRTVIHADQTLREVANAFAVHGTTCAPVIDAADPGRLLGMVDLAQLLHARRQDQYEEHHRQRHLPDG